MIRTVAALAASALAIVSPSNTQESVAPRATSTSWVAPRTPWGDANVSRTTGTRCPDTASGDVAAELRC